MNKVKSNQTHAMLRDFLALRVGALFTVIFFPTFWFLDFFVLPEHVAVTGTLRFICSAYGALLLWGTYRKRRLVRRYHDKLGFVLASLICCSISVMCWLHSGYESFYYAGINTVVIVVGIVFSWSLRLALLFNAVVYFFYMMPLIIGAIPVKDLATVLGNQFFLVTTMLLTAFSQQYRVRMERREQSQRRALKGYLSQVRILATRDALSGLYNRRQLLALGEMELKRCDHYNRSFAVIIADIDHFKKINDTYTHKVGDEVIKRMGEILSKCVRAIDVVGRYGGEEFVIILPESNAEQAANLVASRIKEALHQEPFATSVGPLLVTVSMGVSGRENDKINLDTLIYRADLALYEAKASGRDRYELYTKEMELKRAIDLKKVV